MKKTIQLSLISVALLSQLNAEQTVKLAPLTITSTAIETDELKSTDAVEVYTQEDIEKAHVRNVYEFLSKNTSIFTTSAYGNPFIQKLDMRGYGVENGYQNIVVTINGRKMNNVDMVAPLLSSISPSSIKKIEIVKSSGIVLGGDGANAGAINIITKQGNDKEVSFYMGNNGTFDGSFYLGHRGEKLSINASGEAQTSDGIRDIDTDGNKDENSFETGTFNLAYTPTEELELRLGASLTRTDVIYTGTMTESEYKDDPTQQGSVDYGWGPIPSSSTHQQYDSKVLHAGASYYLDESLSFNVDISNENKESDYITYGSVTDYDYKTLNANLDYNTKSFSLILGLDGFDGSLDLTNTMVTNLELEKTNKAAYVMSEFYLSNVTLKAGYRYEKIKFNKRNAENKEDSLNGVEVGVNYLLDDKSSFFVNYSHSYQSAQLDRLFSYFSGAFTGYVEPSEANNYTVGYSNILDTNKFKISAYYIDLTNEIYYDPFGYQNTNIDKSHKYGLDIYDKYIINKEFNVALNYNYVQAIIDEEIENGDNYAGNELPGVSNHNIKATISYLPNKNTTLSLTQIYRSEAYAAEDFNNNFSQKQDAFNSTDISVTYTEDNWEVFAKINNLFDQSNGLWIHDDAIYPVNYTTTAIAGFKLKL